VSRDRHPNPGWEGEPVKIDEIFEMAYPKRYVEQIIIGLADPINEHLIKLVGFEFSPELRQHFREELDTWLDKIQRLRMKPNNRTGNPKFYYDLLFDYPFGGVEVRNSGSIMNLISRRYHGIRPAKTPEEVAEWLRNFHSALAQRLSAGEEVLDMIPA
jgi:hypothetical protein